jgi:hypothetical protein
MIQRKSLKYLPFSILFVSIFSVSYYLETRTGIPFGNTAVWWVFNSVILLMFLLAKKFFVNKITEQEMNVVKWYLMWNLFNCLRGTFIAESYWDWKGLITNAMGLMVPIVAYAASNKMIFQAILSTFVKYALPLFLLISLFITTGAYGFYLVPVTFLVFFIPVVSLRWKVVVLIITIVVMFIDLGARSNVLKFGVPLLLLIIYYFRLIIPVKLIEVTRKICFITPFIFFFLGLSGSFNIFKMDEYLKGDFVTVNKSASGEINEEVLTGDTRTFLYVEVLQTAQKYNTWLFGRSPARGNETEHFAALGEISGKEERFTNEVAILNVFTWTGLVGVILYLFVFYKASYLAVNRSNNIFCKMIGVFIAFRWMYAWVEDINIFSLTYFFLWFILGFCFSKSFRMMSDKEMKYWVRGIFDTRYRHYEINKQMQLLKLKKMNKSDETYQLS